MCSRVLSVDFTLPCAPPSALSWLGLGQSAALLQGQGEEEGGRRLWLGGQVVASLCRHFLELARFALT